MLELHGMKKFICLFLLFSIPLTVIGNQAGNPTPQQQQPQRQPAPGKKFVDTPFGLQEVDVSDPRPAVAVGPPLPAPPPPAGPAAAPAPAQAPAQAAAAPAQNVNDPVIPISLRFDNQDIYAVIRIIT